MLAGVRDPDADEAADTDPVDIAALPVGVAAADAESFSVPAVMVRGKLLM